MDCIHQRAKFLTAFRLHPSTMSVDNVIVSYLQLMISDEHKLTWMTKFSS